MSSELTSAVAGGTSAAVPGPAASRPFYKTGGTMPRDAQSYVPRRADEELFQALSSGEFCYLLTSRQMGKSSLMVRSAGRLRESGRAVVTIDLTLFGQNLTPEQWYDGMHERLGRQLDLEDAVESYVQQHADASPLRRWMGALLDVAVPSAPGGLVVFIDEIDFTRSLPFSTDELFAAIRECYNRRTEEAALYGLTFCLLGVASPSDLIRDTRTTPFNIGRRIELTDFTEAEAAPLARGLRDDPAAAGRLFARVMHWTAGHPYLTQRLCEQVAQHPEAASDADVDRLCDDLFLSSRARTSEDNLIFVRERLLRSDVDITALLELYRMVRAGKPVAYEESNRLAGTLRLAGIAKVVDGRLKVRNRIYRDVFDGPWIEANLPEQEKRRQYAAYVRGLIRAGGYAAAVLLVIVSVCLVAAVRNWKRAIKATKELEQTVSDRDNRKREAEQATRRAIADAVKAAEGKRKVEAIQAEIQTQYEKLRRVQNLADFANVPDKISAARNLIAQGDVLGLSGRWDQAKTNYEQARQRLEESKASTLAADLGLMSAYAISPPPLLTLEARQSGAGLRSAAFSNQKLLLAAGDAAGNVTLWDLSRGRLTHSLTGPAGAVTAVAFSPDDKTLYTCGDDGMARSWDVESGLLHREFRVMPATAQTEEANLGGDSWHGQVSRMDIAPERGWVLAAAPRQPAQIWDLASGAKLKTFPVTEAGYPRLRFSPDRRRILSVAADDRGPLTVWSVDNATELFHCEPPAIGYSFFWDAAFSPDGTQVVTSGFDNTVRSWDTSSHRGGAEPMTLRGHEAGVHAVAVSPDGRLAMSGGEDKIVRVWDLASGQVVRALTGHTAMVRFVAFSPDGRLALSAGDDRTIRVWEMTNEAETPVLSGGQQDFAAFSKDNSLILRAFPMDSDERSRETGYLFDVATGNVVYKGEVKTSNWQGNRFEAASPSGQRLGTFTNHGLFLSKGRIALYPDLTVRARVETDRSMTFFDRGTQVRTAALHKAVIRSVAFSGDGGLAASTSNDQSVGLWSVATGQCVAMLYGHTNETTAAAFFADGKCLITGGCDYALKIWDLANQREIRTLHRHHPNPDRDNSLQDVVNSITISSDDRLILAGYLDGMSEIWDIGRPALYRELGKRAGDAITELRSNPHDPRALADLGQWYAFRGAWGPAAVLLREVQASGSTVFSPELANTLARCCWRSNDLQSAHVLFQSLMKEERDPSKRDSLGLCLAATESPSLANAAADVPALFARPSAMGTCKMIVKDGIHASWAPDGKSFVYTRQHRLEIYDLPSGKARIVVDRNAKDAAWSPDGSRLAFVSDDQPETIWMCDAHGASYRRLAAGGIPSWSADGKRVIFHSGTEDKVMAISTEEGAAPEVFFEYPRSGYPAVSADESLLAFQAGAGLSVLERHGGKEVAFVPLQGGGSGLAAFSPDGHLVAFGGWGSHRSGLWVLDLKKKKAAHLLDGYFCPSAWSPDGQRLLFDDRKKGQIWSVERAAITAALEARGTALPPRD